MCHFLCILKINYKNKKLIIIILIIFYNSFCRNNFNAFFLRLCALYFFHALPIQVIYVQNFNNLNYFIFFVQSFISNLQKMFTFSHFSYQMYTSVKIIYSAFIHSKFLLHPTRCLFCFFSFLVKNRIQGVIKGIENLKVILYLQHIL